MSKKVEITLDIFEAQELLKAVDSKIATIDRFRSDDKRLEMSVLSRVGELRDIRDTIELAIAKSNS